MSALPDHYTRDEHGVHWLDERVDLTTDDFCQHMAFERVGLYYAKNLVDSMLFNRLPDVVAASDLSPAAKYIYADIFSWVFWQDKPKEYFFGYTKIADDRCFIHRNTVISAVKQLVKKGWIKQTPAHTSARNRVALVPMMNFKLEASHQGTSEEGVASLGETTTEIGKPMHPAVAKRLRMIPVIYWAMAVRQAGLIEPIDVVLYGYLLKLACPFVFRSASALARDMGTHRQTIKKSLGRLLRLRMIATCDHGFYIVAHPLMSDKKSAGKVNALLSMIKEEEELHYAYEA